MKPNSGKITAKIADLQEILNQARLIEGLEQEGIDPVKLAKDTLNIESVLLESEEAAKHYIASLRLPLSLEGLSKNVEICKLDVKTELEIISSKIEQHLKDTYNIEKGDIE